MRWDGAREEGTVMGLSQDELAEVLLGGAVVSAKRRLELERKALKIAFAVANKYRPLYASSVDRDEVDSIAILAAGMAIRDHDPKRGASLSTFVGLCVGRALQAYTSRKSLESISLDAEIKGKGGCMRVMDAIIDDSSISMLESIEEAACREWLSRHLEAALADLPHLYERIVRLFYYEGLSLPEVSHALAIHGGAQRVWSLKERALAHLRRFLSDRLSDYIAQLVDDPEAPTRTEELPLYLTCANDACGKRFELKQSGKLTCSKECAYVMVRRRVRRRYAEKMAQVVA